jgi:phosphonate transport system substrate-binding protein
MPFMLNRRALLAGASLSFPVLAFPILAHAQQDWRSQFKELRLGVSSAENEAGALARWAPVADYLTQQLGVPVRIYRVVDYAGLVEGMRGDQIEFSRFGPAVYSLGRRVMGDKLRPLFRDMDQNGAEGYHSIVIVRADSPYRSIADLKGKVFLFADPNSTSGYAFPAYFLAKEGFDPATHFANTVFSGGHENSVLSIARGQYDAAATHWTNEDHGMVQTLERKGLFAKGAVRIIWTSPLIPASPFCVRANLPQALQDAVAEAMVTMKDRAPATWQALTEGKVRGFVPARHEDYRDVVAVLEELEKKRKQKGT